MVEVLDEEELEVRELIQAKIGQFVDEIKFICGREIWFFMPYIKGKGAD